MSSRRPKVRSAFCLIQPGPDSQLQIDAINAAAQAVGRELVFVPSQTPNEIEEAFETFARRSVVGVLVAADASFSAQRKQIVSLVARHSWPAIYQWREFAEVGGLASFGPNLSELLPASWSLRRANSKRREACGSARAAADQV